LDRPASSFKILGLFFLKKNWQGTQVFDYSIACNAGFSKELHNLILV
jgi:hypothetical protein